MLLGPQRDFVEPGELTVCPKRTACMWLNSVSDSRLCDPKGFASPATDRATHASLGKPGSQRVRRSARGEDTEELDSDWPPSS